MAVASSPDVDPSARSVASWVLFDLAAQPFFTLIVSYVFAPYFAAVLVGDPIKGQALWGYAAAIVGLLIGAGMPIAGAIADAAGRQKAGIAAFSALFIFGVSVLWFCRPESGGAAVSLALVAYGVALVGAEGATAFTNAMMARLVRETQLGRLSGTGVAVGNIGGIISLAIVLGFLIGNQQSGLTVFGIEPIFSLDPRDHEGERAVGPFVALWYLVFVVPLFLFVPDLPGGRDVRSAIRRGLSEIRGTIARIGGEADLVRFLSAYLLYFDGLIALSIFGGIYAVGVFTWSSTEVALFGLIFTLASTIGAFAAGFVDDWIGSKRLLIAALVVLIIGGLGVVSIGPDRIGFVVPVPSPTAGDGFFAAVAEQTYLALVVLIGLSAGSIQGASRSMMARLTPLEKATEFFGFFTLAGRATVFVGPLLIGIVTSAVGSQRAGISVVLVMFLAGLLLLRRVG